MRLLSASSAVGTLKKQKPDYGNNAAIMVIRPRITDTVHPITGGEPRIMVSRPSIIVTKLWIIDIVHWIMDILQRIMTIRPSIMTADPFLSPPTLNYGCRRDSSGKTTATYAASTRGSLRNPRRRDVFLAGWPNCRWA